MHLSDELQIVTTLWWHKSFFLMVNRTYSLHLLQLQDQEKLWGVTFFVTTTWKFFWESNTLYLKFYLIFVFVCPTFIISEWANAIAISASLMSGLFGDAERVCSSSHLGSITCDLWGIEVQILALRVQFPLPQMICISHHMYHVKNLSEPTLVFFPKMLVL